MLRARLLTLVLLVLAPLLSACAGDEPTIALLVADGSDSASRAVDAEAFTERVEATCDECRVAVYDAEGDAAAQESQAREAEADSADVIVVVPVDVDELASLTARDLPVVSMGEPVPASDRFVGLERGEVVRQEGSDLQAARNLVLGDETTMTYVPTHAMSERPPTWRWPTSPTTRSRAVRTWTGSSPGSTRPRTSPSTPSPRCSSRRTC